MPVKKIVSNKGNESSLKISEPSSGTLGKQETKRINKRRFNISKWEMEGIRVAANLSTNKDWWEWGVGVNVNLVVDIGSERGNKEGRIVVELVEARDEAEEIGVD